MQRVAVWAFALILPFMPVQIQVNSILMIIGLMASLLLLGNLKSHRFKPVDLLLPVWFIALLVSVSWSPDSVLAWNGVKLAIPMLAFPLIMLTHPSKMDRDRIIQFFIIGCALASLASLGISAYGFMDTGDWGEFGYSRISYFHHTSYFSMYLNFALVYLAVTYFKRGLKVWEWLCVFLFVLLLLLMVSRNGILVMAGVAIYTIIRLSVKGQWVKLGGFVVGMVGLAFVSLLNPTVQQRVERLKSAMNTTSETRETRSIVWSSAIAVISDQPLVGAGGGSSRPLIKEKLEQEGYVRLTQRNYNAHNQWLETDVSLGIFGLLFYALVFVLPGIRALRVGDFVAAGFLTVVFLSFFTESMLERQAGIYFYAFFFSVIFVTRNE